MSTYPICIGYGLAPVIFCISLYLWMLWLLMIHWLECWKTVWLVCLVKAWWLSGNYFCLDFVSSRKCTFVNFQFVTVQGCMFVMLENAFLGAQRLKKCWKTCLGLMFEPCWCCRTSGMGICRANRSTPCQILEIATRSWCESVDFSTGRSASNGSASSVTFAGQRCRPHCLS